MPQGRSYFHQNVLGERNRERAARNRELGIVRTVPRDVVERITTARLASSRSRRLAKVEELGLGHSIYMIKPLESGYVLVSVVDHPIWGTRSISLHRLLAGEQIGRRLTKDEEAHHRDLDKSNNDPSNIEVLKVSDHKRLHMEQLASDKEFCSVLGLRLREAWARRRLLGTDKLGPNSDETRARKAEANRRSWQVRRENGTATFGLMGDERRLRLRVTKTLLGEKDRLRKLLGSEPFGPFRYSWLVRADEVTLESGISPMKHLAELAVEEIWARESLKTSFARGFVRGPYGGCWKTQAGRNSRRGKRPLQWVPDKA